jgi:hypothetical protein
MGYSMRKEWKTTDCRIRARLQADGEKGEYLGRCGERVECKSHEILCFEVVDDDNDNLVSIK